MSAELIILDAGPALSLQDMGRPGFLSSGLTRGGAADRTALIEGAALLDQPADLAAIEMLGMGGTFEATQDTVIALTGAHMQAKLDNQPLIWNASHFLPAGARLTIGGALRGSFGYLHVAGGFQTPQTLDARSAHVSAGIGSALQKGERLPIGDAPLPRSGQYLTDPNRLDGGLIRVIRSVQSDQFSDDTHTRFANTPFRKDLRANRMAMRMDHDGPPFASKDSLSILSEVIVPGDIQIAGDGAPFVMMSECQTTGGYPRIGTVLPCDLPRIAQAQPGTAFQFSFVSLQDARDIETKARSDLAALPGRLRPLIRNPHDMADLLSYQLISGAIDARADPF
jgi:allophanate hydrolase